MFFRNLFQFGSSTASTKKIADNNPMPQPSGYFYFLRQLLKLNKDIPIAYKKNPYSIVITHGKNISRQPIYALHQRLVDQKYSCGFGQDDALGFTCLIFTTAEQRASALKFINQIALDRQDIVDPFKTALKQIYTILQAKNYWRTKTHSLTTDFPQTVIKLTQTLTGFYTGKLLLSEAQNKQPVAAVIDALAEHANRSIEYKNKHPILYALTHGKREAETTAFYQLLKELQDPKPDTLQRISALHQQVTDLEQTQNVVSNWRM